MPKINEMVIELEKFPYDMSLDLNVVYDHIRLSDNRINLCININPQGKYHYKRLTMVVDNSPHIFKQKMNILFNGYELINAYIDDHLVLIKGYWTDLVHKLG